MKLITKLNGLVWTAASAILLFNYAGAQTQSPIQALKIQDAISRYNSPVTQYAHTKYFGYWGSAMNGFSSPSVIGETAAYSNLQFIRLEPNADWNPVIRMAQQHNQRSLLMVQLILFPWNSQIPHSNWQARFDRFWDSVKSNQAAILGFYLFDEPFWHNQNRPQTSHRELAENLNRMAAYIKSKTNNRIIALTHAYPEFPVLRTDWITNADWVGFNCYLSYGSVCTEAKVSAYLSEMIRLKRPRQKLMITMDAYWHSPINSTIQSNLIRRVNFMEKLIVRNPEVVAITPFAYSTSPGNDVYGAKGNNLLVNRLITVGRKVLDKYPAIGDVHESQAKVGVIRGWAFDKDELDFPLRVRIYIKDSSNKTTMYTRTTNIARADVNRDYGVSGTHGFHFNLPARFKDGRIYTVRVIAVNNKGLIGSHPDTEIDTFTFVWR